MKSTKTINKYSQPDLNKRCPDWKAGVLSITLMVLADKDNYIYPWERGGSVVECRTPEREVRGSRPTAALLCPWARHFTPRKYWLITQEAMAPSRYDWKIVDWDVKPQHNQPTFIHTGKRALFTVVTEDCLCQVQSKMEKFLTVIAGRCY